MKVKSLWKVFDVSRYKIKDKYYTEKAAVKGVSFGVEPGSVFSLLGSNGAGKTTTFEIITGKQTATRGTIEIEKYFMPSEINHIRHLIGYCPQIDCLFDNLTASEHLELFCDLKGISKKYKSDLVNKTIDLLNLSAYRDVVSKKYSGGNKRKLCVAIALLGNPKLIFLDEPSSGMDPESRYFLWKMLEKITKKMKLSSIILTTHSLEEAENISSKIAILMNGDIKTIGSPSYIKNKFGSDFELQIKLKDVHDSEIKELEKYLKENNNINEAMIEYLGNNTENIDTIPLAKENTIDMNLHNDQYNLIKLILKKRILSITEIIRDSFEGNLLEEFQNYIKIKISSKYNISDIFEFMEDKKNQYSIDSYGIKQISLEQIFINLAKNE